MKIPTRRRAAIRFSMTPLIDVTFLLCIFFLAATLLVRVDAEERVDLPEATRAESVAAAEPNRTTVTVAADGTLRVAGAVRDRAFVAALIAQSAADPDPSVRLRCDKAAPFSEVEPLLTACAAAGVADVGFAVLQADGAPTNRADR